MQKPQTSGSIKLPRSLPKAEAIEIGRKLKEKEPLSSSEQQKLRTAVNMKFDKDPAAAKQYMIELSEQETRPSAEQYKIELSEQETIPAAQGSEAEEVSEAAQGSEAKPSNPQQTTSAPELAALNSLVEKIQADLKNLASNETVEKIQEDLKNLASNKTVEKMREDLSVLERSVQKAQTTADTACTKAEDANVNVQGLLDEVQHLSSAVEAVERQTLSGAVEAEERPFWCG